MAKRRAIKPKVDFTDQEKEAIFNQLNNSISKSSSKLEHGKTISVFDLPDCRHKEILLSLVFDPKVAKLCVIAIKGPDNKSWKAYAGYPVLDDIKTDFKELENYGDLIVYDWVWLCENVHDVEQVRFMGELLPKETAIQLFPDWEQDQYKTD